MLPPSSSTLRFTTSMPTPRPEISVAWSWVEKPARKIRLPTASSDSCSSAPISPRSRALARMRSRFRPPPSSLTSTVMLLPR